MGSVGYCKEDFGEMGNRISKKFVVVRALAGTISIRSTGNSRDFKERHPSDSPNFNSCLDSIKIREGGVTDNPRITQHLHNTVLL